MNVSIEIPGKKQYLVWFYHAATHCALFHSNLSERNENPLLIINNITILMQIELVYNHIWNAVLTHAYFNRNQWNQCDIIWQREKKVRE